MKKSRFIEEQILYAIRQVEAGTPAADICRQLGCSEASFYLWKKRFEKLGSTEIRELRQLRDENARLKRVVADLTLGKHILSEVVRKNSKAGTPARAGALDPCPLSDRRGSGVSASGALESRSVHAQRARDQSVLRLRIRDIAHQRPRFGYQRIHVMPRREGWLVNKKGVRPLYRLEGLQQRMRIRHRKHMCLAPWRGASSAAHPRTLEYRFSA